MQTVLILPLEFSSLNFIGGKMNWTGKLFSISLSVFFLIFYKKYYLRDYYINFKQNKGSLKTGIVSILLLVIFASLLSLKAKPSSLNLEILSYQLTMPGLDEELAYRGIMLGLLSQILVPHISYKKFKISPSILITSILFGLIHSLYLKDGFKLTFNSYYFCITFLTGFLQGYITHKTGSLLFAILGHNLYNTTIQIFKMFIN
ncbi:CPBP family intramembrane glutamic endopeptidase [Tenacibaculum holothuriorum]|uniref:CPBP family intramembrane glutamic endopeptidase n=1 Tax=Tenacibaculum holothuriorum TaxID=1635173 RepID=UPI001302B994|nr:CPBP family intramembrane glutamic endopeptidase [Tenacibaculum holothuriorum]